YNLTYRKPPPLVARPLRLEVNERTLADGRVKKTVSRPEIGRLAARFAEEGVEAVAVCFLHSYGNRKNEERARALLEDFLPEVFVTASAEVVPEFREYERFSTTVLNAYVARSVSRYLERLQQELTKGGGNAVLHVMTSSGGVMSTEVAARLPAHLLLSGPAGGVTAAGHLALSTGERQLIAYDMGGTSTDVSLVLGGTPSMTTEGEVLGYPNKVLQMEIETIGAGGGGALPGWIEAASSPWDPRAQGPTPVRPAMDVEASNPQ
ncbi:MAG: hydantoinase/oxoprolinase family protein, partial [Nitrospinota bacterium]|nr:hydantoinase/oxoprolinase family protein [Nitrospinota bacterium]